ncbi:polysaccharide lyase beta-sandwich domain-containing protein [Streptomyces sp. enrichment culture]|uniref:polysaccharide lyase beta-sandwich domain-containing protein n=1 Tax=Streptomyces sp. enrichment culture TaxID=1795815 RepID=UPI003F56904C
MARPRGWARRVSDAGTGSALPCAGAGRGRPRPSARSVPGHSGERFRATPEEAVCDPGRAAGKGQPRGSPARPSAPVAPAGRTWRARAAGSSSVGGLTVARPAGVLLRRQGRTATLCVSDPTRTGEALELEWDHPVREAPDSPDPVEDLATGAPAAAARHSGGGMRDPWV